MITRWLLLLIITTGLFSCTGEIPDYKNPENSPEKRARDLVNRMSMDEKFWQMFMIPGEPGNKGEDYSNGIFGFQVAARGSREGASEQILEYDRTSPAGLVAEKINSIQKFFIDSTRLGIPIIPFDEALHGLVRNGATAFPQSIGLAATFDTIMMSEVAACIAEETRSRGIRQILSPVVNIARDVRWGRTEETYGEDPFLSSKMAVAFVKEFETRGVITTPKHFVANIGAGGRDSYPVHFNERLLEEIYFPAFKSSFLEGGSRSVMTAYNSLDGSPCTANKWLLREKLKNEWGFDGFVISDAGATGGSNDLHFTSPDYHTSGEKAIEAGLDVLFQTSYSHYHLFKPAFDSGAVEIESIDDAVYRVLKAKFELGLFEDPYVDPAEAEKVNGSEKHLEKALEAARKSIVLLKNEKDILPVDKDVKNIALIGTDATEARLGGYSGPGVRRVSILDGIKEKAEDAYNISYAPGCGREDNKFTVVDGEFISHQNEDKEKSGFRAEYFDNPDFEGRPIMVRDDRQIDFRWTLFSPGPEIPYDWYSVKWTGVFTAPVTGNIKLGIEGNDGYQLYINDELIINNREKKSYKRTTGDYSFVKGREYEIRIEYRETTGNARIKFIWDYGVVNRTEKMIVEAINIVEKSDLAIVVAGIEEGEYRDRALLKLPGRQAEMINRIAGTGVPVVVVLIGGSAITMSEWIDGVSGVIDVWYPGDMGGYAVADVLFGLYNPAGRLPVTFPLHEGQLPLYYNHKPTGRGDDYINLTGKPLFPFGYGLSYTDFEYSDIRMDSDTIRAGEETKVRCRIKNTGDRAGDEVVQMYIRDELSSLSRPVKELRGFGRISLEPGEEKEIEFTLGFDELSMLDADLNRIVEPGKFRIMIGSSSVDIRLRSHLYVIDKE